MSKWADHVITGVRYNLLGSHIDYVELQDDLGSTFANKRLEARSNVILLLRKGRSVVTAPPSATPGQVNKGAPVEIVTVNYFEYLRTDRNGTPADNLGNLPRV